MSAFEKPGGSIITRAKPITDADRSIGIPTLYRGVLMRSRIEARWAAFFDSLGWPWEYELLDLKMYIPDFIIDFEAGRLLVEVKSTDDEIDLAKSKIECSGWDHEALIVVSAESPEIGAFMENDGAEQLWGDASLFFCLSCGRPSIHCSSGSWRCRQCGADAGNAHVGAFDPGEAWAAAGNRVQWAPKR